MGSPAARGRVARFAPPATLLTFAIVAGGGGSPSPVAEVTVQLAALSAFGLAVVRGARPEWLLSIDPRWIALLVAITLFPLLQLAPLPWQVWRQLPGRDAVVAALNAAGQERAWLGWSLLPDGTVAALLALLPALALALMMALLPLRDRVAVVGLFAALGVAAALVGIVQFIGGGDRLISFYPDAHRGWAIGFFANRNAQADLVAITLLAVVLVAARHRARIASTTAQAGVAGVGLVLLMAGVATGSRMGMAVLGIPVLLAVVLAGRRAPRVAVALGVAATLLLAGGTALDRVTARVHDAGNRTEIWGDSLLVAQGVAPWGAGMGAFQPLYAAAERLDHVQPTIANRAHNDYLELAIEGGLPALALLTTVLAFVARRVWSGWRDTDPDRRVLARFAGLTAAVFVVHSCVDYPLRNLTLLSVAGLALGGLAWTPPSLHRRAGRQRLGGQGHG